jgi:hypothetical protein
MQACHRLLLRAWSSSNVEAEEVEEVEDAEAWLPAGEGEEGLLADVMLFFLGCCGYYFVVLNDQCNLSPDYPQYFMRKKGI